MAKPRIVMSFHHFVSCSETGIDGSFASEDSQGRNEKAVKGIKHPSLYRRMLVSLRLFVPALCRVTSRSVVLDQKELNRLEQYERSGYNRMSKKIPHRFPIFLTFG